MLAGDQRAFDEFVRSQDRLVRGVIYGILGDSDRVDDVSQQVWATVWQQIGTLQDAACWKSWLYRMARNAALDAGREITRRRKLSRAVAEQVRPSVNGRANHGSTVSGEQRDMLMDAVKSLSALYREPFVLRHLEGWSYRQIADLLDMPIDTVETRLVRARRQLRETLKGRLWE
jgi:RNA polymerase sigma-70 factor (ECF subfamily)